MTHVDPGIFILGIIVFGIIFFECLTKSLKVKTKFWKIVHLILAVLCSVIVTECILRFVIGKESAGFLKTALFYLMRTVQCLLCLVGIGMSVMIALKKDNAKSELLQ